MICLQSLGIKQALAVDKLQLLLSDTQATVLLHCGEIFNFIHLLKDHKICSGTIFTYGGLNFAVILKKKIILFLDLHNNTCEHSQAPKFSKF